MQLAPPPPQPSLCCHRHTNLHHTGFCPSCLRERLAALEYSSSSRLRALSPASLISKPAEQASVERRRRTKSFSASKDEGLCLASEPKRKSCDVRVRGNLTENSPGEEIGLGYMERMIKEIEEDEVARKDCTEVDPPRKKSYGMGFLAAASGFRKKWYNWRHKAKNTKQIDSENVATLPVDEEISRQYRETQSEVADYRFRRRSCDDNPRFSLGARRISFDDPRYSFEEPRTSCDEHLIRTFTRMPALEDAKNVQVPVVGSKIRCLDEDVNTPGGSVQTKEYYLNSSSRRRKSLDRCNQIRKIPTFVVAESDELNMASNSNSNPLRDDPHDQTHVMGNEERKEARKSRKWDWRVWGFRHENGDVKNKNSSLNGCASSSIHWQNGNGNGNRFGGAEMNGNGRKEEESVLEKNWSLRYPSNHIENGLLRFYLTPIRCSRRRGLGKIKIKPNHSRMF